MQPELLTFDPELARLAYALDLLPSWRIWAVGRCCADNQSGSLSLAQLKQALAAEGVRPTAQRLGQLLKAGHGCFWNYDPAAKRVHLAGVRKVAVRMVSLAAERGLTELVAGNNRPGARLVEVKHGDLAGNKAYVAAMVYAAWHIYRNEPTISRLVLCRLFHCDERTLHRWEKRELKDGLRIRRNIAQATAEDIAADPDILLRDGHWVGHRFSWQMSNTYFVNLPGLRTTRKGQARKVRTAVNQALGQPASVCAGGGNRPRSYYASSKRLRRALRQPGAARVLHYLWRCESRRGVGRWSYRSAPRSED